VFTRHIFENGWASVLVMCQRFSNAVFGEGDLQFITCSCYNRQPGLGTAPRRDLFLTVLERVRRRYRFGGDRVCGDA